VEKRRRKKKNQPASKKQQQRARDPKTTKRCGSTRQKKGEVKGLTPWLTDRKKETLPSTAVPEGTWVNAVKALEAEENEEKEVRGQMGPLSIVKSENDARHRRAEALRHPQTNGGGQTEH